MDISPLTALSTSPAAAAAVPLAAGLIALILLFTFVLKPYFPRIHTAEPNEWLIIISKGQQRLAGVGLKEYVWPMETCVTFPSVLTKVSFEAMQTTKEMQGVKVSGFAVFSVFRDDDGPFRYYKTVQGGGKTMAEDNLRGMAESLMRKHVANTSLGDVMRNREDLRRSVKDEMMATTKGWGVWLETFEIKDVHICSKNLFEDMQAEFRQDTHVRAEQVRLQSSKVLAEQQSAHDKEMALLNSSTTLARAKAQTDERTTREKFEADAQLSRAQMQATLAQQKLQIEQQKIETEKQLELTRQAMQHALTNQVEELQRERDAAKHGHELRLRKASMELDGEMSDRALQKHTIDTTAAIYSKLPLKEIKLSNFVAPDAVAGSGGLAALLPGVGALSEAMRGDERSRV